MSRIVEKLKKFGYIDDSEEVKERPLPEKGSVEDIFYAEDGILPDSRGGLSLDLNEEVRFPWEKPSETDNVASARKKRTKTSLAELTLPEGELRRLRHMAIRTKSRTKIKGAGVTKDIVDLIHEKWKTEEVVRLKCEGPPALNMKRMHEILEVSQLLIFFSLLFFKQIIRKQDDRLTFHTCRSKTLFQFSFSLPDKSNNSFHLINCLSFYKKPETFPPCYPGTETLDSQ